jgi:hypothetical protein
VLPFLPEALCREPLLPKALRARYVSLNANYLGVFMRNYLLLFALSGCAIGSASVPPETVVKVAADELGCPASKIKVKQVTDNNWTVTGCGKTRRYLCSGSNFMTDGTCFAQSSH